MDSGAQRRRSRRSHFAIPGQRRGSGGGLSERQFTRVFKSEVGLTAAGYVEAVRLESACRLLETTNRTIAQIARTSGFGTPATMNRTFRRRLNTTPGDHRHHFRGASAHLIPEA